MSEQDKHEQQDEEQADLEVEDDQADEVEGGGLRVKVGADRDPKALKIRY